MATVVSPDRRALPAAVAVALLLFPGISDAPAHGQQLAAGQNINVVGGPATFDPATGTITGDPYLQRQNEPALALSSRNPCHLLAGANDYRTVDVPGLPDHGELGDAWLGVFKSIDCGQTWTSTLLPGYLQDKSAAGTASPLKGLAAAADALVRPSTEGLFLFSGIAFNRGPNEIGKVFVARYLDRNNKESGDPIAYLDTKIIDVGTAGQFLDKPWLVTDLARDTTKNCSVDGRAYAGGNAYLVYSSFVGGTNNPRTKIMFSRTTDCGQTWSNPSKLSERYAINQGTTIAIAPATGVIHVAWREFANPADATTSDTILYARSNDQGKTFSKAVRVAAPMQPFSQGTSPTSFRTNAFPAMAVDGAGRVYIAWAARGFAQLRPDPVDGDARIVMITSPDGVNWTAPRAIDPQPGAGHQFMPSLTLASGKLVLTYYDLREDVSGVFEKYVDEAQIVGRRHTIDVRAAVGDPGSEPQFAAYDLASAVDQPSSEVSRYLTGTRFIGPAAITRTQLQFNPPNLKLFSKGRVPFIGDYIDVAGPIYARDASGAWKFASALDGPLVVHAIWTDNRDVRKPRDGDWENYTPPLANCTPGQTGVRNQNIYTSRIKPALVVSAPGNAKTLGVIQRAFVVHVQNTTDTAKNYRLRLLTQPAGGRASFRQQDLLTEIDATIPRLSSITRTVYVMSPTTVPVPVDVIQIDQPGGAIVPGGIQSSTILNPDIDNPDIDNPDIDNPDIDNPDIDNAEVHNPDIDNPDIDNPDIDNPDIDNPDIDNPDIDNPDIDNHTIANPDIDNPDIDNPDIDNPDIDNPDIDNPDIDNPDIDNSSITDVTWKVENTGNTTSGYRANLFLRHVPSTLNFQLIVRRVYTTPAARSCDLSQESQNQTMVNIVNPRLDDPAIRNGDVESPSPDIATFFLAPGQEGRITLRIRGAWDPGTFDPSMIAAAVVAQAKNNCPEGSAVTPGEQDQCDADLEVKPLDIYDPFPPEITAQDVTVNDTDGDGAEVVAEYGYSVHDSPSDEGVVVTCSPAAGTSLPVGQTSVTCTASDAGGNTTSVTFTVTVNDITAPTFPVQQDIVFTPDMPAQAEGPGGAVVSYTMPVATDASDPSVVVACSPDSGSTFAIGETPVNCTASDSAGNSTAPRTLFSVNVVDTLGPVVTVPSTFASVPATGPGGATVTFSASAVDLVDGPVAVSCTPASGSTFPVGTTIVTCTAVDSRGNASTSTFTVNVSDTVAPVLTVPSNISGVQSTGAGGATVTFSTTAVDLVDGSVAVSCVPSSGSTFPIGTTSVTCTASDTHGNTSTGFFTITVVDSLPPSLTMSVKPTSIWEPSGKFLPVTVSGTAADSGSGLLSVTYQVLDEYGTVQPAGPVSVRSDGTFSIDVLLQASRLGSDKNGRLYTIVVKAIDLATNAKSAQATVVAVEHDVRK